MGTTAVHWFAASLTLCFTNTQRRWLRFMRCFTILATRGSGVSASLETVPWKRAIRAAGWKNHAEVKAQFHDSDLVGEKTVLNIAKNLSRKFSRTGTTTKGAWKQ